MSYSKLGDAELSTRVQVLINSLAAHKVTCLDDAVADSLAATLQDANTPFAVNIKESVRLTSAKQTVNEKKRADRQNVRKIVANVHRYIEAADGPESDYSLCGFDFRDRWSHVTAQAPDGLSAVGNWTDGNKLKYKGNNKRGRVKFEIWRSDGRGAEWSLIGNTGRQSYVDRTAVPGKHYWYKVRAQAARNFSAYSNFAIVYKA